MSSLIMINTSHIRTESKKYITYATSANRHRATTDDSTNKAPSSFNNKHIIQQIRYIALKFCYVTAMAVFIHSPLIQRVLVYHILLQSNFGHRSSLFVA